MIRRPTPHATLYQWHNLALTGARVPITSDPQCGYFLRATGRRNDKATRYIPASIYVDALVDAETGDLTGPEILRCEIGGAQKDPAEEWTWLAGKPITRKEYQRLVAERAFGGVALEPEPAPAVPEIEYRAIEKPDSYEPRITKPEPPLAVLTDGTKMDF